MAQTILARAMKSLRLLRPFRQSNPFHSGRSIPRGALGGFDWSQTLGFTDEQVADLVKFNLVYEVPEVFARWMMKDVIVRAGLIYLSSSLQDRAWTLEGGTPESRAFHRRWLTRIIPEIMEHTAKAVWFGWQPLILNYRYHLRYKLEGGQVFQDAMVPHSAFPVNPYTSHPCVDDFRVLQSIETIDGTWPKERAIALTWFGEEGNLFGQGQASVVFPYWIISTLMRLWLARNAETNLQGRYAAFCRKGLVEMADGTEQQIATIAIDALSQLSNGDWITLPQKVDPETGKNVIELEKIESEDRMDSFLKGLGWMDRMKLIGTLLSPDIGFDPEKGTTFSQGRTSEKTQTAVLEGIGNIPIRTANKPYGLIENVHEMHGLPGDAPRLVGRPYRRDQEELYSKVLNTLLTSPLAHVDKEGNSTGLFYTGGDLVDPADLLKQLGMKVRDPASVARSLDKIEPGKDEGGRPPEPISERQDDRNAGLSR